MKVFSSATGYSKEIDKNFPFGILSIPGELEVITMFVVHLHFDISFPKCLKILKYLKINNQPKQAGAELCQAQYN